jgi:predicted CXXCH cytochrome family protein
LRRLKWFFTIGLAAGAMLLIGAACTPGDLQALQGTLQNIDTVSGNVTVKLNDGSVQTYNFNDVNVSTIRQALGTASVEIGDGVTVERDRDGRVRKVEASAAEVQGVIKGLGTARVTIDVDSKSDITLHVADNTSVRLTENARGTFSDLKVGQNVQAKYDVASGNAVRISVAGTDKNEGSSGTGGPDSEGPPRIPHAVVGREDCVSCHGQNGAVPFPKDHGGRTSAICQGCHQASPASPAGQGGKED